MRYARLLCLLFGLLSHLRGTHAQSQVCNNAEALCSRTYDNITHLGAHDSPFVRNSTNGYSIAGNQLYTSIQQLDSGIRLLSAQVHEVTNNGETQWRLCHSVCSLYDAGSLVDWLSQIKSWLDRNPNEVVTLLLVNANDASASTLGDIYTIAGLDTYSYLPPSTTTRPETWPTLSTMISSGKRLVTFIATLDPTTNTAAPYLLDEFTFIFENSYENYTPSDFSCEPDRPPSLNGNTQQALSSNYMPLMNHFRYDEISGFSVPNTNNLNVTNAPDGPEGNLGDAAARCAEVYGGRAPTFILTDFTNVGPALEAVDMLNGVSGLTGGRLVLPDSYMDSMAEPSPSSTQIASVSATGTATGTGTGSAGSASSSAAAGSGAGRVGDGGMVVLLTMQVLVTAFAVVGGVGLLWMG